MGLCLPCFRSPVQQLGRQPGAGRLNRAQDGSRGAAGRDIHLREQQPGVLVRMEREWGAYVPLGRLGKAAQRARALQASCGLPGCTSSAVLSPGVRHQWAAGPQRAAPTLPPLPAAACRSAPTDPSAWLWARSSRTTTIGWRSSSVRGGTLRWQGRLRGLCSGAGADRAAKHLSPCPLAPWAATDKLPHGGAAPSPPIGLPHGL